MIYGKCQRTLGIEMSKADAFYLSNSIIRMTFTIVESVEQEN